LGPLRGWLSQLYLGDSAFRETVKSKNGNALADAACASVEAYSANKGKPWFRAGPKKKDGKTGKAKDDEVKQGGGPSEEKKGDGPKGKKAPADTKSPSMSFENLAFRSIYATVDIHGVEDVAEIILEPNIGCDSKGVGFSSVGHYLRNIRRLHRRTPQQPLAVVIPGSTVTIAKVIAKVVEREEKEMASGKENPESGLGCIPPMSDYVAPARDTDANKEVLRNAVMIQMGTGFVKLRDEVVGHSDFTLTHATTVELVATWPQPWAKDFPALAKKRQVSEIMELTDGPTPEIYSFREPKTKRGVLLKQCMFRVREELHTKYTISSGKKGLFVTWARRIGVKGPWREDVWMRAAQGGDDLGQAYQNSRVLEGFDGLIFSDVGLGARILPDHIKQARLALRPNDHFYDEDNAHVLTVIRYDVEGLHVDVAPTALSRGLREWGWDTVPVKTRMRDSRRIITVGSAAHPSSQSAYVLGCPLAINPVDRTDVVTEVANRITPLNPAAADNERAPFFDIMNMHTSLEGEDQTGGPLDCSGAGGMSSINCGSPEGVDGSWLSGSTSASSSGGAIAPTFGSVVTDLAVGGIAARSGAVIKENAEVMKAKYDDLREWCDNKFQQMEQTMKAQSTRAGDIATQLTEVAASQGDAEERSRQAEAKQERNQQQLMNMLTGLTNIAAGGSGQAALSFAFPSQQAPAAQTSFLGVGGSAYGPAMIAGVPPLASPYAKAGASVPPGGGASGGGPQSM
jgi:hypothetical protein